MKKLAFILLLTLSGCLGTTTHHPYRDGRSTEQPWWRTPYYADTPKDQNPWLKFVHDNPDDKWYDPWGQDDLRNYGVDVLPGYKAPKVEKEVEVEKENKKVY